MSHSRRNVGSLFVAAVASILLALEVVRTTLVTATIDERPQLGATLAPNNPQVLAAVAMAGVGEAAASGNSLSSETHEQLSRLAAVAPLEAEPYLVEAALAARGGDYDRAERLLTFALQRAPRSVAARYLMADLAIQKGKTEEGLRQIAILSRLVPAAAVQLVPSLSEFARTTAAPSDLAAVLSKNPQLKRPLLTALSADPENAELVLHLAGPDLRLTDVETQAWKARLLQGFISRGEYERSYALWTRFVGRPERPRPLLFNGEFESLPAPPPFNWNFSSSSAGVAEPANGHLRVLYYGRDATSLASQLLLLPPGRYRFEAPVSGQVGGGSLRWIVQCVGGGGQRGDVTIAEPGTSVVQFTVPAAKCNAQLLELRGAPQDMPQQTDVQIGPVTMRRTGA